MEEKNIILTGNPNTGKTTLFNALTGLHQKTGNWPGVTVEIKEGSYVYRNTRFKVIDLPGTYSLTSFTEDEKIAREILVKKSADAVIVVADSTNLERNLYLVTLMLELKQNVIVAVNMYDVAQKKGINIDTVQMENILGVKFIKTVANKKQGVEELKETIYDYSAKKNENASLHYGIEAENAIAEIESLINDIGSPYPSRFFATRLIEKDPEFISILEKKGLYVKVLDIIRKLEEICPDIENFIIEKRYGFIHGIAKECTKKESLLEEKIEFTARLDKLFTHSFTGGAIFLFFMWLTFQIVFTIGGPFAKILHYLFSFAGTKIAQLLDINGLPNWIISLFTDGIISGLGAIIVFLPNIFLLFFIFAALEDSGYIARAAFVTDRVMHKVGLHGKSAIPMLLGFGCNVPAIMSTRTLETKKDRIITILALPFMSCSARLPVYLLFTGVFFRKNQGTVLFSLYIIGIIAGLLTARIFKTVFFKSESSHIIMELPPYHTPEIKNMLISAWEKSYLFLRKAGTMIFAGVFVIWVLSYFPLSAGFAERESYTGVIGSFLVPVLRPAGFGTWQAGVALMSGLVAKELVVGTLGTVLGGTQKMAEALSTLFTPASAYAFMLMTLLYIPCIATVAVIKQEAGIKWALVATVWSIFTGWLAAVLFYQAARLFL
ncbi:MAG TPA: ferrous iron transport protein B [bacterium]|nr:ferrous iron transport protein B [bacterium]